MTTMKIRDVSLYVKVVGQGDPLVLMHGGPGLDHTSLLPLEPLADQFTLVFYDHRCNGRSEGADVTTMTWENLTADADTLRQTLGFEKWAVLGHSFGGNVALEYWFRYPGNVTRLILMDTGGDAWWGQQHGPELLAKRGYSAGAVQAARRFFNGQLEPREFTRTALRFGSAYFYRINPLGLAHEILFGPSPKMRPETQIYGFSQLLPGWNVMDRLGDIRVPTLVMAGRHDFLYPPEHQAIVADRIPGARLVLIERAGHNPQLERSAETLAALRTFLTPANPGSTVR